MIQEKKEIKVNSSQTVIQRLKKHFWFILFVLTFICGYIWYTKECPKSDIKVVSQVQEKTIIYSTPINDKISKKVINLTHIQVVSLQNSIRLLHGNDFKVTKKQPGNYYRSERSYLMHPINIFTAIKIVRSYGYDVVHLNDRNYDQSKDFFIRVMKNESQK